MRKPRKPSLLDILEYTVWLPLLGIIIFGIFLLFYSIEKGAKRLIKYWSFYQFTIILVSLYLYYIYG